MKPGKELKANHSKRATLSSIFQNPNLKAVFLYTRSMLAIYILAVDPFPHNATLREVIAGRIIHT